VGFSDGMEGLGCTNLLGACLEADTVRVHL
jgi:hypothetical protein